MFAMPSSFTSEDIFQQSSWAFAAAAEMQSAVVDS